MVGQRHRFCGSWGPARAHRAILGEQKQSVEAPLSAAALLCCMAAETDPMSAFVLCTGGAEISILLREDAGGCRSIHQSIRLFRMDEETGPATGFGPYGQF
jgi:hypothetical protein